MRKDTTMDFGQRLHHERRRMDYSQQELADRSGTTQQYISQLESGERNPSLVTVRRIADALDVGVAELMEGGV